MSKDDVATSVNTEEKPSKPWLFKAGQPSANPRGRPKGSRNKLGETFIQALYADFDKHGAATIEKVREDKPHEYLKVVASLLPKELNVRTTEVEELSDDELAGLVAAIQSVANTLISAHARAGASETDRAEPPPSVSTLQ